MVLVASLLSLLLLAGCGALQKKKPEVIAAPPQTEQRSLAGDEYGNSLDPYRGNEENMNRASDESLSEVGEPEHRVYFDYDSDLLSTESQQTLSENARWIRSRAMNGITIEGHSDERGTREYNLALGQKRADSVRHALVSLGVPGDSIQTVSFGKERPLVQGHSDFAWSKNRRADIVLR